MFFTWDDKFVNDKKMEGPERSLIIYFCQIDVKLNALTLASKEIFFLKKSKNIFFAGQGPLSSQSPGAHADLFGVFKRSKTMTTPIQNCLICNLVFFHVRLTISKYLLLFHGL